MPEQNDAILDLQTLVFAKKPRENAGARSSNRFDYQKDWAIVKLTELHASGKDYLLAFEFHDDIAIFDASENPSKIEFYQVKTQDKPHWLLTDFAKTKKDKDGNQLPSIFGKLNDHLSNYGNCVAGLFLITNSKVQATLTNDTDCMSVRTFDLKDVKNDEIQKLSTKLTVEFGTNDLQNLINLIAFRLRELDINQHSDITKAKLSAFIEAELPDVKYQIGPFYTAIFDEVKSKSNVEETVLNFDRLKAVKAISRSDFERYLSVLKNNNSMRDLATSIENRLNQEKVDYRFVSAFKSQAKTYELQRMNYGDKGFQQTEQRIFNYADAYQRKSGIISDDLNVIYSSIPENQIKGVLLSEDYIKTIILFRLYEKG